MLGHEVIFIAESEKKKKAFYQKMRAMKNAANKFESL